MLTRERNSHDGVGVLSPRRAVLGLLATPTLAQDIGGKWYGVIENYNGEPRRVLGVTEGGVGGVTCTWDQVGTSVDQPAKCTLTNHVLELVTRTGNGVHLRLSAEPSPAPSPSPTAGEAINLAMSRTPHPETPPQQVIQWMAAVDLEGGIYRNCGDPPFQKRQVEIKGKSFTATPEHIDQWNPTTRLNLAALKPDGSGRITVKSATGGVWHFDFDAGQGPRVIHVHGDNVECACDGSRCEAFTQIKDKLARQRRVVTRAYPGYAPPHHEAPGL